MSDSSVSTVSPVSPVALSPVPVSPSTLDEGMLPIDSDQPLPTPAEVAALTFDGRAAYERQLQVIASVDEGAMLALNRDPVVVVGIALKAWPVIAKCRALLEKTYQSYDFAAFDALPDFANATQYLNERIALARVGTDELSTTFTRAGELRDLILGDVPNLVRRRKMSDAIRGEMRGPFGYAEVAYDLGRLSGYYLENWSTIEEHTGMTKKEIAEAEAVSGRLRFLVANREKTDAAQAERALRRQQVFTLLARSYETVRLSLIYPLHLEGKRSIEEVAPSIYAVKRGKKGTAGEEITPARPKAPPGENVAPVAPVAPTKPMQATEGVPANIGEPFAT